MEQKELYRKIAENVVEMEDEVVESLCRQSLEDGYDAADTINGGLIPGMNRVSELYEEGEYYLPTSVLCFCAGLTASFALNAGVDVLKPHLKQEQSSEKLRVVIGVVEGDTHDIGKNLVKIMTESAGIEVFDLGRDVPLDEFIRVAEEEHCDFICMSTLMTTTGDGYSR